MIKVEINKDIEALQKTGRFSIAFEASTAVDYPTLDVLSSVFNSLGLNKARAGFLSSSRLVVQLVVDDPDVTEALLKNLLVRENPDESN